MCIGRGTRLLGGTSGCCSKVAAGGRGATGELVCSSDRCRHRQAAVAPMSAVLLAATAAGDSAPKALRFLQDRAGSIVVVALLLCVVVLTLRQLTIRRALAKRVRFAVIPTESFDPTPEDIVRFASMMARTRRAVRGLTTRRTDSVRIRLRSIAGGRIVQSLEGPKRSLSILRLSPYPEVELRPPDSVDFFAASTPAPPAASSSSVADPDADEISAADPDGDDGPGELSVSA